jgi:hydroxymethylglutaryl-CoA lyase
MLNGLGVETKVDISKVIATGDYICERLGRANASKAAIALKCKVLDLQKSQ